MPITPRQALPRTWTHLLADGPLGIGHDVATTEKKTSNPSSITVMERIGGRYYQRLVLVYKTSNEEIAMAMIKIVLDDIRDQRRKARRLCVDSSSEVFFAQRVKRKFISYCPIELIKGGSSIQRGAESFSYKQLLGNLYSGTFEDGLMAAPNAKWYRDDQRRVQRDKGTFVTETGENGEHGDTFDSGKLAYWALEHGTGRVEAHAAQVGAGLAPSQRPGIRNPFAALHDYVTRKLNS